MVSDAEATKMIAALFALVRSLEDTRRAMAEAKSALHQFAVAFLENRSPIDPPFVPTAQDVMRWINDPY